MSTDDTAASEHGADSETTQVPPPPADEPELAWSVDDYTDEMSTNRHGRLMWAGLAVLVAVVTAALVFLVSTLFGRHDTNNAHPQLIPSSSVTTTLAAAPPPPLTVAVPAPQPTSAAPEDKDSRFIGALRARGLNPPSADGAADVAHRICAGRRAAVSRDELARQLYPDGASAEDLMDANYVIDVATRIYCPQYSTD
jgi:Protein of unknown function (DUF732)